MSSTTSTSGSKITMFAAKSGFVIPKNKLSGSLVPVLQGSKKPGGSVAGHDQNSNQSQRKTKWGSDLTQDAAVKKGRALAYEKRVDQIKQQLESGTLKMRNDQDPALATPNADEQSSDSQIDNEKVGFLELERREAIGEILKLNPRYKAPPDYKPLMKEARLPIPVKEYPEFDFASLILGPGGDNQKRLEKETGAKIQLYGNKASIGGKVQISPPDGNVNPGAYEELHVKISAETYEKLDAAVGVVELLITSVSGNLGASPASASGPGDSSAIPYKDTTIDPSATQQAGGSTQTPQSQFHYHGPILNNPVLVKAQPSTTNSSNLSSSFGHQPSPILQSPYTLPSSQSPMQVLPRPFAPRPHPINLTGSQRTLPMLATPQPVGSYPQARPSMSFPPQAVSGVPPRQRPLSDLGSGNMGQGAHLLVSNLGPRPVSLRPGNAQPSFVPSSSMPMNPSVNPLAAAAPKPPQGDFTFRLQHPNNPPASLMSPRLSFQPAPPNAPPTRPMIPLPNAASRPVDLFQTFSRPQQFGGPMGQPQTRLPPSPFPGDPNSMVAPPRGLGFQNLGPPVSQMRPRNFGPSSQVPDFAAPFHSRPANPMPLRQNYPTPNARPWNHEQFKPSGQQVYDPFSPTDA